MVRVSRYTPGPWEAMNSPDHHWCVCPLAGPPVAICIDHDDDVEAANAYLIAAAPEMYDVLKNLVTLRNKAFTSEKPTDIFAIMQGYWDLARHALAKAEAKEGSE